jgi:hypothetical protein
MQDSVSRTGSPIARPAASAPIAIAPSRIDHCRPGFETSTAIATAFAYQSSPTLP